MWILYRAYHYDGVEPKAVFEEKEVAEGWLERLNQKGTEEYGLLEAPLVRGEITQVSYWEGFLRFRDHALYGENLEEKFQYVIDMIDYNPVRVHTHEQGNTYRFWGNTKAAVRVAMDEVLKREEAQCFF